MCSSDLYHSKFKFTGQGFEGLQAFGGLAPPYRGIRLVLHKLFQRRFRRMGKELGSFYKIEKMAKNITKKQGRAYDLDVLRQSITLAFLSQYLDKQLISSSPTTCVIGDGFASMTSLLLASGLAGKIVLINLSKTLLVDLWYLRLWMGSERFESSVDFVTDEDGLKEALAKPVTNEPGGSRVIAIEAANHTLLQKIPVDLVMNIASMQEMDPSTTEAYFDDMRAIAEHRRLIFYCCNREEKTLPDGAVTRFSDYPWQESDKVLVDALCPWHQQFYTIWPPLYRSFHGAVRHRLVIF